MRFWTKSKNTTTTTTTKQIKHIKTIAGAGNCGCVAYAPPSQLIVTVVVKLFNCFDAIGRNVNKQS